MMSTSVETCGQEKKRGRVSREFFHMWMYFSVLRRRRGLTFGKEGDVRTIMKSFTEDYPISIVASTQRIVHSPKRHTFGSVIYNAKTNVYYEEEPYRDIEVVDRIGSGDAYISGVLYGLLAHNGDCQKALEYGNATSSVKNTIPGDLPSSDLREIERIIRAHKSTGRQSEMDR